MACLQSSPWSGLQMLATVASMELEARKSLQTTGHFDWKYSWDNGSLTPPSFPMSECGTFDLSRSTSSQSSSSASSSSSLAQFQPQRHAYSPTSLAKPPKKRRIKTEIEDSMEESMYKVQKLDEDDSDKENRTPTRTKRRSNRSRKTSAGSDSSFSSTSSRSSTLFPTPPASPPIDYNALPPVPEPLAQNALEKFAEYNKLPEFISYDGPELMNMMYMTAVGEDFAIYSFRGQSFKLSLSETLTELQVLQAKTMIHNAVSVKYLSPNSQGKTIKKHEEAVHEDIDVNALIDTMVRENVLNKNGKEELRFVCQICKARGKDSFNYGAQSSLK